MILRYNYKKLELQFIIENKMNMYVTSKVNRYFFVIKMISLQEQWNNFLNLLQPHVASEIEK